MVMMGAGVDVGSSETYKSDLSRLHQLLHDKVKSINSYFGKDGLEAVKLAEDLMALNKVLEAEKQAWTRYAHVPMWKHGSLCCLATRISSFHILGLGIIGYQVSVSADKPLSCVDI